MVEELAQDLDLLWKADSIIGRIWLNVMARRFGLLMFAGLTAAFGLGMADLAGFYGLRGSVGPVSAAAILAMVDFLLAAIVAFASQSVEPGPELDMAFEVRKKAIESIKADAGDLKGAIGAFGQEIRATKESVLELIQNPLDAAAQKILIPAIMSVINGMRSRKEQT